MKANHFIFNSQESISGNTTWTAPSNIALVKYWGKSANQIPKNPSVSFTLSECITKTTLSFKPKQAAIPFPSFELYFDDAPKPEFAPKVHAFFKQIEPFVPFIKHHEFKISTSNSFPHSSGIASSASGMAALAACIMEMERRLNPTITDIYFYQKTSFLARLGSGSASRSVQGKATVWGTNASYENASNLFAIPLDATLHATFKNYCDTILLVDEGSKQVSSSKGHQLMRNHPFAKKRFEQAHQNIEKIKPILENGEMDDFMVLVESEALTLHAMMMASNPYFILMQPNTLEIIKRIWAFRKDTQIPVCFTLDAGANVHLLYPENAAVSVKNWVHSELTAFCQNHKFIADKVGDGIKML